MDSTLFKEFSSRSIDLVTAPNRLLDLPIYDVLIYNIDPRLARSIESRGYCNVAAYLLGSLEPMHELRGPLLLAALTGYDENFSERAVVSSLLELPHSLCYCLHVRSSCVTKAVYEFFVKETRLLQLPTNSDFIAFTGCVWFSQSSSCLVLEADAAFDADVVHAIPVSSPSSLACASVASRAESSSSELPFEPLLPEPAAQ